MTGGKHKLELILAPHPIFSQVALPVEEIDDEVRGEVAAMFDVLAREDGIGLGANMVGLLKRLIVVDLKVGGVSAPLALINPQILSHSQETETAEEASLSFPGLSAPVSRFEEIEVAYLDLEGTKKTLEAKGLLARVIQHEMDYLDGRTYLNHISPMRRRMLMKKLKKAKTR